MLTEVEKRRRHVPEEPKVGADAVSDEPHMVWEFVVEGRISGFSATFDRNTSFSYYKLFCGLRSMCSPITTVIGFSLVLDLNS